MPAALAPGARALAEQHRRECSPIARVDHVQARLGNPTGTELDARCSAQGDPIRLSIREHARCPSPTQDDRAHAKCSSRIERTQLDFEAPSRDWHRNRLGLRSIPPEERERSVLGRVLAAALVEQHDAAQGAQPSGRRVERGYARCGGRRGRGLLRGALDRWFRDRRGSASRFLGSLLGFGRERIDAVGTLAELRQRNCKQADRGSEQQCRERLLHERATQHSQRRAPWDVPTAEAGWVGASLTLPPGVRRVSPLGSPSRCACAASAK